MDIGSICAKYRKEHGYRLRDIADDLGFTIGNISAFEHGRNDNGTILLWYVYHGLDNEYIENNGGW